MAFLLGMMGAKDTPSRGGNSNVVMSREVVFAPRFALSVPGASRRASRFPSRVFPHAASFAASSATDDGDFGGRPRRAP